MIELVPSTKTMVARRTGSIYRAISAEAGTKHGYLPSLVIYDELAQAKNRDLMTCSIPRSALGTNRSSS
jgi:hypothetical protein